MAPGGLTFYPPLKGIDCRRPGLAQGVRQSPNPRDAQWRAGIRCGFGRRTLGVRLAPLHGHRPPPRVS